jgi:hypothetical protein
MTEPTNIGFNFDEAQTNTFQNQTGELTNKQPSTITCFYSFSRTVWQCALHDGRDLLAG